MTAHLYFHSQCFDGIVSSVLAWDFLAKWEDWDLIIPEPVDYDSRYEWLNAALPRPFAVVDFLYHPQASFWADHHASTFMTDAARLDFEEKSRAHFRWLFFDRKSPSCASLLWYRLAHELTDQASSNRYAEMVAWADRIDSAWYESVEEAIFPKSPALQINASLTVDANRRYLVFLVRTLRKQPLDAVVQHPDVYSRVKRSQMLTHAGLQRVADTIQLADGQIATFEANNGDVIINRYSPYYFYPTARYSVGLVKSDDSAKITAMRNPWIDFPSRPIGAILQRFGGGGHERVGSVILNKNQVNHASLIQKEIVRLIRSAEPL